MKRYSGLLLVLAALGALLASQAAVAAPAARPASAPAHPTLRDDPADEEFEAEEGEFEFEECEAGAEEFEFEEAVEEFEDGEEFEAECGDDAGDLKATPKGAPSVTAPAACKVHEAESTISASPASDELRLSIRYSTFSPTQVTVGVKLKDHQGSVPIAHATRHVGTRGTLQITTKLGAALMERALAASEFDVSLRAPETPAFCAGALEQRLHAARHTSAKAPRVYAG
jgi:hypothetical protein